ncbi:MAG TPA: MBL fold metallo-hydrolase [Candidatus Limnocylindrales bacterium]|nr:MBL fold metallo-hydrolase [Candidatus Limnocylindrales bacterium]
MKRSWPRSSVRLDFVLESSFRKLFLLFALVVVSTSTTLADDVVPTSEVTNRVVVRAAPSAHAADIGSLRLGEKAELLGSVPSWYRIRLANGTEGFVAKRWTRVVSAAAPALAPISFTIDAVDVGTGLGILVRGPDFTLVYDAGSNDDLALGAENRMLAYIKTVAPGLATINHVILSHPHRDHVQLMADLFSAFQVNEVWDSGALNPICAYRAFLAAVRDEPGAQYHTAAQNFGTQDFTFTNAGCAEVVHVTHASSITTGSPVQLGQGASMTFLYVDGSAHPDDFNKNSLVVRLDLGGTRVLLMGDAQAGGRQDPSTTPNPDSIEGSLLACCASELPAKILVVGHHGSKTSSRRAFLDAVGASVFIVSAGPTKYGSVVLPDQVVIDELTSRGRVFRTDLNDTTCGSNTAKIGPDADGKAGGCDNVRAVISLSGDLQIDYWRGAD